MTHLTSASESQSRPAQERKSSRHRRFGEGAYLLCRKYGHQLICPPDYAGLFIRQEVSRCFFEYYERHKLTLTLKRLVRVNADVVSIPI